jgi:hypothetical protein
VTITVLLGTRSGRVAAQACAAQALVEQLVRDNREFDVFGLAAKYSADRKFSVKKPSAR